MYYSHTCSYCGKLFYTYNENKEAAAQVLFDGIKKHLIEYGEDHKEYQFDKDPSVEIDEMYYEMHEQQDDPYGDYKV